MILHPLISVIVPVYNVEGCLERCIQSILVQTYENMEIILIDDGSTDSSGAICDRYSGTDNRIRIIHQANGGLSDARNSALNVLHGEYLAFIDSDDFVSEDYIEYLYHLIQINDADISFAGSQSFADMSKIRRDKSPGYLLLPAQAAIEKMLLTKGCSHTAWGKLYRSDLWSSQRFPKGLLYEDYATIYRVFADAHQTVFGNASKYYYYQREDSIMKSKFSEENLVLLDISDDVTKFIIEKYPDLFVEAMRLNLVSYCKVLKNILDVDFGVYRDEQLKIINYIKKRGPILLKSPKISKTDKIKIVSLYFGRRVFYMFYKMGDIKNSL